MDEIISAELSDQPNESVELDFDLRPILRRWELLRVFYNVILVVLVLAATAVRDVALFEDVYYWERLVYGAVAANACFMCGPLADAYLKWFQIWHIAISWTFFAAGTMLTAVYAVAAVFHYPNLVLF